MEPMLKLYNACQKLLIKIKNTRIILYKNYTKRTPMTTKLSETNFSYSYIVKY